MRGTGRVSRRDSAKALAALHASRELQRRNHAAFTLPWRRGWHRIRTSLGQPTKELGCLLRPPAAHLRGKNHQTGSRLASCKAEPLWSAALPRAEPSPCSGDTKVVSMASCAPCHTRRLSNASNAAWSRSRTKTLVETRPPASLHTWAAAHSNGKPLFPNTTTLEQAAR